MGNIVLVASQKGGVGKTTTALNLAYSLSRFGERTLVIDADPQGSLAAAANLRKRTTRGLIDLVRETARLEEVVVPTRDGSMAVASLGIATAEDVHQVESWAASGKLAEIIARIAQPYVNTVIDAPSGIGAVVEALLTSAQSVVVPVQPRTLTLKTLPTFLRAVQHARRRNPELRIAGVVVTMLDADRPADRRAWDEIRAALPEDVLFRAAIPADDLFEEASQRAVPVALVPGGQRLAGMFIQLALELRERNLMWETSDGESADLF
ncbi:MAG: ParA family protein [Kofleriaceae bacterium]|jgi:chromosome partitioning protein|nr:ParA family protein [Kofleriaceae bacterium]MBP9168852.1 ParA family protein [Kofleriaceae bacterium]MBP9862066.1 ParA family protein [Kofleriaceae bacterium]